MENYKIINYGVEFIKYEKRPIFVNFNKFQSIHIHKYVFFFFLKKHKYVLKSV